MTTRDGSSLARLIVWLVVTAGVIGGVIGVSVASARPQNHVGDLTEALYECREYVAGR